MSSLATWFLHNRNKQQPLEQMAWLQDVHCASFSKFMKWAHGWGHVGIPGHLESCKGLSRQPAVLLIHHPPGYWGDIWERPPPSLPVELAEE